ncbi:MAG: TonB-dependent receptor, partial [Acidobacteriia bacterium]|nr:TonB-dependent receptor [Terriglobia bacterium]
SPSNYYQVLGNPNLVPETSTTNQVGFDYRLDRIRFSGTYFRNDIKNLIQADLIGRPSTPQGLRGLLNAFNIDSAFNPGLHRLFFLYRNVDNVYTTGIESKVEVNLTRSLVVSSSYTYLDARDKETKAFLSQRHRHHGNFRVWWSTSRWGGLRTNFRGTYFSKWPIAGRSGSFIGNAYQVWDWYIAKPVAAGSEFYFALDNLFDSTDSNLQAADPSFFRADPGRTFRVGMRWNFGRD